MLSKAILTESTSEVECDSLLSSSVEQIVHPQTQ